MNEEQRITAQFAAQVLGLELSTEPPAEGSPLWQLEGLVAARKAEKITEQEYDDALDRLRRKVYPPAD